MILQNQKALWWELAILILFRFPSNSSITGWRRLVVVGLALADSVVVGRLLGQWKVWWEDLNLRRSLGGPQLLGLLASCLKPVLHCCLPCRLHFHLMPTFVHLGGSHSEKSVESFGPLGLNCEFLGNFSSRNSCRFFYSRASLSGWCVSRGTDKQHHLIILQLSYHNLIHIILMMGCLGLCQGRTRCALTVGHRVLLGPASMPCPAAPRTRGLSVEFKCRPSSFTSRWCKTC